MLKQTKSSWVLLSILQHKMGEELQENRRVLKKLKGHLKNQKGTGKKQKDTTPFCFALSRTLVMRTF